MNRCRKDGQHGCLERFVLLFDERFEHTLRT